MPEYHVSLEAHVWAEWIGEAGSEQEARQRALDESDDLEYEVDFMPTAVHCEEQTEDET